MHRKDDAMIFQTLMEQQIGRHSPQVAKALGVSYTRLRHELNPFRRDYKFGFLDWRRYLMVTGYLDTLDWICHSVGGVFVPLDRPREVASDYWLREAVQLFTRTGAVADAICTVVDPAGDGGEQITVAEVPIFEPPFHLMIDHAVSLEYQMLAHVVRPEGERRKAG